MSIYLDVDALNAKFWATALTYKNKEGEVVTLPASQKLVEGGPAQDVDETQPWVRWVINPGSSKPAELTTAARYKQTGNAILQIFVPKIMGDGPRIDIADSFHDAFKHWRSPDKALRVVDHNNKKGPDKSFLQVNAIIQYESLR